MEHEHYYEYKTNELASDVRWEDCPVVITYISTLSKAELLAEFLSKLSKAEVRFNEQGSSQGHYVMHDDVFYAWLKRNKKEGETK